MTNSSSGNNVAPYWTTAAALFGAIAVAGGLHWRQQRGGGGGANKKRRDRGWSDNTEEETASDAISAEGSVMVTLPHWAVASSPDCFSRRYRTDSEMMGLAIHLSDRNITDGTGGPFGAAIFERHHGHGHDPKGGEYCTLVSIGVNRVVPLGNCTLHAEMVAIQLAQRRMGSHTLMLEDGGGDGSENDDGLFYDEEETKKVAEEEGTATATATGGEEEDAGEGPKHPTNPSPARRKRRFELFTSCEPCAMCLGATLWSGVSRVVCGATKSDAQAIGFDEGPVFEESYRHLERAGVSVTRNVRSEDAANVLRRYGNSGLIYNR